MNDAEPLFEPRPGWFGGYTGYPDSRLFLRLAEAVATAEAAATTAAQ